MGIGPLIILHHKKYGSLESTISKTIAKRKSSRRAFSVTMMIFFPLYYAFLYFWVGPMTHMPDIFYALILLSAMFELIFVWVPAAGDTERVHEVTAGLVSIGMILLMVIMVICGYGLTLTDYIAASCFILLAVSTVLIVYLRKLKRHTFMMEFVYCAAFALAMSIIAHS